MLIQHVRANVRPIANHVLRYVAIQMVRNRTAPNRVGADARRALRRLVPPDRVTLLRIRVVRTLLLNLSGPREPVDIVSVESQYVPEGTVERMA